MSTLSAGSLFNAAGSIRTSVGAIASTLGGKGYDAAGFLTTDPGPPTEWSEGLPYKNGKLAVVDKASLVAPTVQQEGLTFDSLGRVVVVTEGLATAPTNQFNGLTFDASGALVYLP